MLAYENQLTRIEKMLLAEVGIELFRKFRFLKHLYLRGKLSSKDWNNETYKRSEK